MTVRKAIFWTHLGVGVIAGVFIFIMSATGVVLTYEHALINAVSKMQTVDAPEGAEPMSLDALAEIAMARSDGARLLMMSVEKRERAPLKVYQIGLGQITLDPYTGEEVRSSSAGLEEFMHWVVDLHRWLGAEGASRKTARAITGAMNLLFLFLVVTGIYLWLPKVWKWAFFRINMLFQTSPPTAKARDYNWHHVFGFWALIPLFLIVASGAVISYPWANAALYRSFGEEPPKRQGPAFLSGASMEGPAGDVRPQSLASFDEAFAAASGYTDKWKSVRILLPMSETPAPSIRLLVNTGGGILPEQRTTLTYDRVAGEIAGVETYADMSAAAKARMWVRFIHTGEQYGLIGSTIAGLSSLAACFLVYTGFALSYRHLIRPLLAKRRARA